MNCKNVLVGSALVIASIHLLAAAGHTSSEAEDNRHCHCIDDADPAAIEKIKLALRRQLPESGLEYTDTPLTEVLNDLQNRFAIPFHLDQVALEELGVNRDEPVTASLRNISLEAALQLMLRPLGLTFAIENEVLLVTTCQAAEKTLVTCIYDVRDLAATATPPVPTKGASAYADCNRLVDVVTYCIAKDTWSENGGNAEIRHLGPDLLVVSQTRDVHERIQNLLNAIRRLKPAVQSQASSGPPNSGEFR